MSKIIAIATEVPAYKNEQTSLCNFANTFYGSDEAESRKLKYPYSDGGIAIKYSIMPHFSTAAADRQFFQTTSDMNPLLSLEKRMQWYGEHAAALSVKTIEKHIAVNK